jgi:two-component system phosphate regulon sensor histidine kinase PhoR
MYAADVLVLALTGIIVLLLFNARARIAIMNRQESELSTLRHDLQQAQDLLQATQQNFFTLTDASFDALLIIDSGRHIVAINQAACELFNVTMQEAIGNTVMTVTRHHELDALVGSVLGGEERLENQIEIDVRTFRVRGMCNRYQDRVMAALALLDVTELLRLTRARRDMVANLSHDLRTPIANIRLLIDTLNHNFGKNLERDRGVLSKITSQVDSLQHMTQELIDLSMIESGKAIMRMVRINFSDIMRKSLEVMEAQIEAKKLEVVNETLPDTYVLVDDEQMRRVITNILHNAIKFTPARGQIYISTSHDDQTLKVCIRDSGPGIPPHERTRVFERFYQVETARTGGAKSDGRGTGLGLAIAKHIVEAHGGKIWADAGIPSGACLYFTLPLAE